MTTTKRLIDVSHTVEEGMVTYPGFPAPVICDWCHDTLPEGKSQRPGEVYEGL